MATDFEQVVVTFLGVMIILFFLRSIGYGEWAPPEMIILKWLFEPFFKK